MVAYKEGRTARLISRPGKEFTQRFPELAKAVSSAESVTLDTEVAVFDRQLIGRFEWLRGQPKDDVATPPMLMAFDLLWQEVIRAEWEGPVAKDPESPYVPGRTLKWLKVKQRDYRVEERGWDPKR